MEVMGSDDERGVECGGGGGGRFEDGSEVGKDLTTREGGWGCVGMGRWGREV